jgi:hypothetical protein
MERTQGGQRRASAAPTIQARAGEPKVVGTALARLCPPGDLFDHLIEDNRSLAQWLEKMIQPEHDRRAQKS